MIKARTLIFTVGFFTLGCGFSQSGVAAEDYAVPRTEWGQPDLQGVWNFSSDVPMQRPRQFGERQFLNQQEIEEIRARQAAQDAASDSALGISGVDES